MKLPVRALPIAIGVAALVLGLRVGDLWRTPGTAQAQQPQPAAAPASSAPAPSAEAEMASEAKPAPTPPAAPDDITNLTGAEIAVLQQLVARRAEIEKRAVDVERREALLKAAEERIDTKIQEIKKLQGSVEQAIRRYDEQEEKRRESLVKIYETMKPNEAARIFEQMDLQGLVEMVERMGTRKVAPILAQMNPVRAKQVTAELAKRRKPGDPQAEAPAQPARAGG